VWDIVTIYGSYRFDIVHACPFRDSGSDPVRS
jgi:hypothetical protein